MIAMLHRIKPAWWTLFLVVFVVTLVTVSMLSFSGGFQTYVPVTLTSDRAGLVMDSGAKVKLRGVQVGQVSTIRSLPGQVQLKLNIDPDEIRFIPANVTARIRATTAFGAKYVDLVYPDTPVNSRLAAGATIPSQNVATEVNTVFQNLTDVLHQIEPAKLNAVLVAFADGLRGQGERIGQATTGANEVLAAINARQDQVRRDWRSLAAASATYAAAAQHIIATIDAASTTSETLTSNSAALDSLLLNVTGFANSGATLLGPNLDNFVDAINTLEPTTALLDKYSPQLTCTLTGAMKTLEIGTPETGGLNGKSLLVDAALLLGDDPYQYPQNLPIIGAKGGPGGQPSCGSLPDVSKNWPMRYLVTNTGWGTGLDERPNPGIGFPGWANYFPVTRANPRPPSVRNFDGPAPGPQPFPGAPPYGAQLYAPDGTPLWPGLPPAPQPGAPREPGPLPPGSEPFTPPFPAQVQPTPLPDPPPPPAPEPTQ